jgi:hypothetical protein
MFSSCIWVIFGSSRDIFWEKLIQNGGDMFGHRNEANWQMSRMESINGAEIQFLLWKMKTHIFWFPYGNYKCRINSIFIMENENAYFFDNSKLRILSYNTVVSNRVNSDHVPSFSCLAVWNVCQTTSGVYAITVTSSAFHSRRCGRL